MCDYSNIPMGVGLKRYGHITVSPLFGVLFRASLLAVGLGSWVMAPLGMGWIQLEGSREQSYVPAPGHCAQEFENAAILSLVTTFLPLPSDPACLTEAHTLLSSPSDRARKLS